MKKKIIWLLLLLLPLNVFAASGSIKASSSSSKVTLNNTFSVTVKVSSSDSLGSWRYDVDYDKDKLSLISGKTSVADPGDGTFSSKSYTLKFKAIKTGSAYVRVENADIVDWNSTSHISTSSNSLDFTIKEPVVYNYSSDNNLKSLSVDGFEITPAFNKSKLEYSVTAKPTTTSIKINASASDSKAKISGTGEKDVVEGNNSFSVVVKAENGSSKTYTINVTVPEKDPVKFTYNGEDYSVLRKLPEEIPNNFSASTIKINGEEVACLQNQTLKLTLIYMRNKNNKESFYIYNESKKSVVIYNEVNNNDITILIEDVIKDFKNMVKTTVKINEQEVNAYQIQNGSKDYIIYGKNTSTGESNYYVYDKDNKTINLFNENDFNYLLNSNSIYKTITYILGILIVLLFIILILVNSSKRKLSSMVKKYKQELFDIKEKKQSKKK